MAGQPVVLRHSYTRSREIARDSLRYYQMRPRGPEEPPRAIFAREGTVSRNEAGRLLDAHQAPGGRYLAHQLMLSPPEDQRPEDLRDLTRYTLEELEKARGQRLHWVAVEHHNTEHPHVHVIVAGGAEGPGSRARELRLDRRNHTRIKDAALDHCRTHARVRNDWERAVALAGQRDREEWTP